MFQSTNNDMLITWQVIIMQAMEQYEYVVALLAIVLHLLEVWLLNDMQSVSMATLSVYVSS